MSLFELFVRRPVLSTVLSLLVVLIGFVSYTRLTVREYPNIDEPIVSRVEIAGLPIMIYGASAPAMTPRAMAIPANAEITDFEADLMLVGRSGVKPP